MNIDNEKLFLKKIQAVKNEHDQYIYNSTNGKSIMNLPYILLEYKEYLLKKNLIKLTDDIKPS